MPVFDFRDSPRTSPAPQPSAPVSRAAPADRGAREHRAVLDRVRFHNRETGFVIAGLRGGDSVKGTLAAPSPGIEYHFVAGARGGWQHDARYGWTFAFNDATPLLPTSSEGVGDYLLAHAPWMGRSTVRAVLSALEGEDVLSVLKNHPERVAATVRGITLERAQEIRDALLAREKIEAVEVEVRGVVAAAEVTGRQIRAILDRFGNEAALAVRADPYRLIEEIDGIGWETADRIATSIGFDREGAPRIRAGIMHALAEAEREGGHTALPYGELLGAAAGALTLARTPVEVRVQDLIRAGELVTLPGLDPNSPLVFRAAIYAAESAVASAIVQLLAPGPEPPVEGGESGRDAEDDPLACLDQLGDADTTHDSERN